MSVCIRRYFDRGHVSKRLLFWVLTSSFARILWRLKSVGKITGKISMCHLVHGRIELINPKTLHNIRHQSIHTHSSATKVSGFSTTSSIPTSTFPPTFTMLITPALRATMFLFASLTTNFSCSPFLKCSICGHGFLSPVTMSTGCAPAALISLLLPAGKKWSFVPLDNASRSTPCVVMFSPMSLGLRSYWFNISSWMRWT